MNESADNPVQDVIDAIDALVDEQMAGGEFVYGGRFLGVDPDECSLCGGAWHGDTWAGIDPTYDLYDPHGRLVGCPGASAITGPQRIRWRHRQLQLKADTMQLVPATQLVPSTAEQQRMDVNELLAQTVACVAQMAQEPPLPPAYLVPLTSFATQNTMVIAGVSAGSRIKLARFRPWRSRWQALRRWCGL